jgi:WD40 repeat protein
VSSASAGVHGELVASAGNDGTVRIWNTGLEDQLRLVGRTNGPVRHVAFVGGRAFAAAEHGLYIWTLPGRAPARSLRSAHPLVDGAVSGARLAALRRDGSVLLRPRTGTPLRVPPPGARIVFDRGGRKLLVTGGSSVVLVDLASGRRVVSHVPGRVRDAAFAGTGAFAVGTTNGRVVLFSAAGRQTHVLAAGPSAQVAVALSQGGARVASGGRDGIARIWSARTGRLQHRLKRAGTAIADVEFSPDGRFLATSTIGGDARLWSVADGLLPHVLNAHSGRVAQIAFSDDSQWLLTAGPKSVALWQVSTGNRLFYLYGHSAQVEAVAFSADDSRILTGSDDQTVRMYQCYLCGDVYALAKLAHNRLVRIAALLTPRERRRYLGG